MPQNVGRSADIWAVGGLVLFMATGDPPWKIYGDQNIFALFMRVIEKGETPPLDSKPALGHGVATVHPFTTPLVSVVYVPGFRLHPLAPDSSFHGPVLCP